MEHLTIGICGGTCSGKTTLSHRILEAFPEEAIRIEMDSYYKDHPELTYDERCLINYDHPDSFETDWFIRDIKALQRGETVDIPVYDFTIHGRSKEVRRVESRRIIILDGILLFENEALTDLMDIRVFVDTDADVRILRRAIRDQKERARSIESVASQYLTTVKEMHEKYVEPSKKKAHIIVPEGGENDVAFEMITSTIIHKLKK